ncbi:MAG: 7-carboxy-7-deazaguanine synthase QueE [Candidatus Margulisiibacteriota bacterium]
MSTTEASICEIFNSIQGEGLYLGERQSFIRFAGCNLSCQYCDTPQALSVPKEFKVEFTPGKKNFKQFKNPATAPQLIEFVSSFEKPKGVNHSLSLTGGEPLLQVDFLKKFIPELRKEISLPIYLETNGVLPDHLAEVIDLVDIISFDIKLPSATGLSPYWKEHKKALEIAYMKEVFVKIVFTRDSKAKEMDEAVSLIADLDEKIPLVLSPVTPHGPIKHRPNPDQILAFQAISKRRLEKVKVIPQVHKIFGIL